jgi:hypothetical protein
MIFEYQHMQTVDAQKIRFERAAEFFRAEQAMDWPELMEICRPKEVVCPVPERLISVGGRSVK